MKHDQNNSLSDVMYHTSVWTKQCFETTYETEKTQKSFKSNISKKIFTVGEIPPFIHKPRKNTKSNLV